VRFNSRSRVGRDCAADRPGDLHHRGCAFREPDGAGAQDSRRTAARNHRPLALHLERQLLLQRTGAQGFRVQSFTTWIAYRLRAAPEGRAPRNGLSVVSRDVPESRAQGVDVGDSGRKARTVAGCGAGLAIHLSLDGREAGSSTLPRRMNQNLLPYQDSPKDDPPDPPSIVVRHIQRSVRAHRDSARPRT
jgi:hypothetical protein